MTKYQLCEYNESSFSVIQELERLQFLQLNFLPSCENASLIQNHRF